MRIPFGKIGKRGAFFLTLACLAFAGVSAQAQTQRPSDAAMDVFRNGGTTLGSSPSHPNAVQPSPNTAQPRHPSDPAIEMVQRAWITPESATSNAAQPNPNTVQQNAGNPARVGQQNTRKLSTREMAVLVKRIEDIKDVIGVTVVEIQDVSHRNNTPTFQNGKAFVFCDSSPVDGGDKFYDILKKSMKTGEQIHVILEDEINDNDDLLVHGYRSKTVYWIKPVS